MRKPINGASAFHQRLRGICGSRAFHFRSDLMRDEQRSAVLSSLKVPPFNVIGCLVAGFIQGDCGLAFAFSLKIIFNILIQRPFCHIAQHVIQSPWIRLQLFHFVIFSIAVACIPCIFTKPVVSFPNGKAVADPALQAYSHSASVGKR